LKRSLASKSLLCCLASDFLSFDSQSVDPPTLQKADRSANGHSNIFRLFMQMILTELPRKRAVFAPHAADFIWSPEASYAAAEERSVVFGRAIAGIAEVHRGLRVHAH
jgi:hypothetical protein